MSRAPLPGGLIWQPGAPLVGNPSAGSRYVAMPSRSDRSRRARSLSVRDIQILPYRDCDAQARAVNPTLPGKGVRDGSHSHRNRCPTAPRRRRPPPTRLGDVVGREVCRSAECHCGIPRQRTARLFLPDSRRCSRTSRRTAPGRLAAAAWSSPFASSAAKPAVWPAFSLRPAVWRRKR